MSPSPPVLLQSHPPSRKVTPRSARSTADGNAQTSIRTGIGREMDVEMLSCPLDVFQSAYLPFTPTLQDITTCFARLQRNGLLVKRKGGLRWGKFFDPLRSSSLHEKDAFSPLQKISEQVAKHTFPPDSTADRYSEAHFRYQDCPNDRVASEIQGANFRIDGCFRLNDKSARNSSSAKLSAPDIAVVAEYKKHGKDKFQNRKQLVSAASHVMNDDPRRAFMFGITIEDMQMSLWYFSRSHSTMSEPFDIMTASYDLSKPQLLVSVFLSLLFGTEEKLGYDPAVSRYNQPSIYYEYKISGDGSARFYRTCGALSSYRSLGITGRMTRIWKAVEIREFGGEPLSDNKVALKDVWLDHSARTEGSIQQEIFDTFDSQYNRYQQREKSRFDYLPADLRRLLLDLIPNDQYRRYFLEIGFDGWGIETKPKPTGASPELGLFGGQEVNPGVESRSHQLKGSDQSRNMGSYARSLHDPSSEQSINKDVHNNRTYLPKRRYLLTFTHVCTALHDVPDLHTTFLALSHASIALTVLFVADWVHRDVSTGNILVFGDSPNAQGKLSDLEYAKKFMAEDHSADPKTGTPFFMATEILAQTLIPVPVLKSSADFEDCDLLELTSLMQRPSNTPLPVSPPNPTEQSFTRVQRRRQPVIYNLQHDMESLWWIALWTLLARVAHEASQDYAKTMFINQLNCWGERWVAFTADGHLELGLVENLSKDLSHFAGPIEQWRQVLLCAYQDRHAKENFDDPLTYSSALKATLGNLSKMTVIGGNLPSFSLIALRPRPPPTAESTPTDTEGGDNQRKRLHSTDDAGQAEPPPESRPSDAQ